MIKHYIPISLLAMTTLFSQQAVAQDQFSQDFESIRQELVSWDPVRGEWLSSSLVAMSRNQPIPDRMFPEDFTPMEMLKVVPASTRTRMATTAQTNASNNRDSLSRQSWNQMNSILGRANCKPIMGRTYGDPHLSSFDGASYSFQTVGEFILARSASGNVEVQARQRPQTEDISLNTAVAMNVAGDRVCLYSSEKPDGNNTTPVRLNGEAIYIEEATYYLPHGGTIRRSNRNNYLVTWPTGETVNVDIHDNLRFPFMNIAVQVFPCVDTYEGILGNANGRSSDDFDTRGGGSRPTSLAFHTFGNANDAASQAMEREYLAFMAKDFARSWRITQMTSLFDYGFGQDTWAFTDESFPRVHHTLADLTPDQRDRARRDCERNGISGDDLNGCIYDRAFVDIPPSPRPVIPDKAENYKPRPVIDPKPNVNPGDVRRPVQTSAPQDKGQGGTTPQTMGTRPVNEIEKQPQTVTRPESGQTATENPVKATPVEKPATSPVDQPVTRPTQPTQTTQPAKQSPPVTTEEEKPRGGNFGRLLEKAVNSGSGSSGSGSSNTPSSSGSSGNSTPVSKPAPTQSTPTPATKTPAPSPKTSPIPTTRGGR